GDGIGDTELAIVVEVRRIGAVEDRILAEKEVAEEEDRVGGIDFPVLVRISPDESLLAECRRSAEGKREESKQPEDRGRRLRDHEPLPASGAPPRGSMSRPGERTPFCFERRARSIIDEPGGAIHVGTTTRTTPRVRSRPRRSFPGPSLLRDLHARGRELERR